MNFFLNTINQLFFFIIVTTIGLNIIFGIIVDTFSELRNRKVGITNGFFFLKIQWLFRFTVIGMLRFNQNAELRTESVNE